ncbi:MAG TPA: RluA family pseudouridine synthase [Actinomycetota bacterium]|nr:RluA family pseudouridine synthase [Actinomycetota bacterium]
MISFQPDEAEVGERVDVVLARRAQITRSQAQRALKTGTITIEGLGARPGQRLEAGQTIAGEIPPAAIAEPQAEDIPITIRYSDEKVLVVSKPAGIVTHPARGNEGGTLVNALLGLGGPLSGARSIRPGIVHRLDKDTSGLLLVAKDDTAHETLLDAMRRREIERRYLALVRGRLGAGTGTIEAPIGRHPARRKLMAVTPGGRPSVTHYSEIEATDELSLLEVKLETGRTHQIRVHLAHVGHPVVGDRTYGGSGDLSQRLGLDRFFLHAWKLGFPHPDDGRRIEVTDPLPDDLASALNQAGFSIPEV